MLKLDLFLPNLPHCIMLPAAAGDLWLLAADDTSSLLDAVLESFNIQNHQVHHRLFVCASAHDQTSNVVQKTTVMNITPGTERLGASGLKVTHVVSQSDVVKLLFSNKQVLEPAVSQTIESLALDVVRCSATCYRLAQCQHSDPVLEHCCQVSLISIIRF